MGCLGGRISRNEARRMTAIATDLHPNRKMLLRHLAAENAHDMAGTLATVHPDCVFRDFATGQVFPGLAGAERHYRQWWAAFGNVEIGRASGRERVCQYV